MDAGHIDVFLSVLERRDPQNWQWERYPGAGCWQVTYKGYSPPCKFHIEAGPTFIYFHAAVDIHIWAECRLAVYRYALRLNEEISGAKFGLNHEGQLALMVECLRESLTFASFETAVQMLLAYYQTYHPDIQLVAQDVDLAKHITVKELQQQVTEEAVQIKVVTARA